MGSLRVSVSDGALRRINSQADEFHCSPEALIEAAIETVFGPASAEIGTEIDADAGLRQALEKADADRRSGRLHSHEEVVEWHRSHRR